MRLSNKLSLIIFFTGFFSLIIISVAIYWLNYSNFLKSQLEQTSSLSRDIAEDIERGLDEKVNTALTLANSPIIKEGLKRSNLSYAHLSPDARNRSIEQMNKKWKLITTPSDHFIQEFTHNKIARFLKSQQMTLKGEYGEIFLTNKYGALVASTSKLSTFAHGHKYWWQGAYDNGEGAVFFDDRGYDDSVGGYVLGLVIPVRKDSEIIGILKCNLNIIGSINKLLTNENHKLSGQFKLTRSGGMIVFEEGFKPLSTRMPKSIVQKMDVKDSTPFILNDSGVKYLIGLSELELTKNKKGYGFGGTFESIDHKKGNLGESWYLICYREAGEVLRSLGNTIKWILLVGSLLVIILIVAAQFFSRTISQPLSALNDATKQIGDGNFDLDINIKHKDEFGRLADAFKKMALNLKNTTTSIVSLENDIVERKKIEEALQASKETFSKAFQNAPILMTISSLQDGRYLDVNEAFVRVTGYKRNVAVGSTSVELGFITKQEREKIIREHNAKGRVTDMELTLTKAHGSKMYCLYSAETITVSGTQQLLSLATDITDRKNMEARLLQAQKMESIGNLAGGIAHDFNNLLFPIIGLSELLLEDLPEGSLEAQNVKEIFLAGKRASALVNQILAFSRQSEHKMAPVRLQNILKEVLKLSRSTIPTSIEIHENIHQDCGLVMADPTQIHQVAMNLITNAFHAVDEKNGIISVQLEEITDSVSQPGKCIRLSVSDNGIGMSPNTIQKIFEPYFTTKEKGKGTGLGLAVVYGIVKEHKGEIKVNSEIGKGTTFKVYLPLMKKYSEIVTADNMITLATGTESILLVDDEVSVAKLEGQILSRLGYHVTIETKSSDALNTFRANSNSFDMVISDMTMPDMSGDQLSKEILSIKPDTPIIICTGFSERINKEQAEIIGVKGFLMKPVVKSDMAQMVREILDESKNC